MCKTLILLFWLALAATAAAAQNDFSESKPYRPRELQLTPEEQKKLDRKKSKEDRKTASEPTVDLVETIRIPVFVEDSKGVPLRELRQSDFKVFVDGAEREIKSFEKGKTARRFLLVVDSSPSIAFEKKTLRGAALAMIGALRPDDLMRLAKFDLNLYFLTEMTGDRPLLEKKAGKLRADEGTAIYDSIRKISREYLRAETEPPIVLLLTDGIDTISEKADYASSLAALEKTGAVVFPFYFDSYDFITKNRAASGSKNGPGSLQGNYVGTTEQESRLGRTYLQDVADLSGGIVYTINDFEKVETKDFDGVFERLEPQYYLAIEQRVTSRRNERRQLTVRVARPNLKVRARGSFVTGED
ncbi:MAG: VWA domain-containing protein [Acidobacteria bacterium]|nr:VWA domain-containing protein [Acidobacteriota bacterium]